ncbi:MAG TPA: hypothetical protein VNA20_07355 [Frankiaceae bacterium]|nr:hypothetical protein [Frankiaceae bacterium]
MPIALGRFVVPVIAVAAVALGTQAVVATPTVPAASSPQAVAPFATVSTGTKAVFVPVTQRRVLSTTSISPTAPRKVTVAGVAGVPADATAVVVNVAAVKPAKAGFLVAYPSGTSRPATVFTLTYAAGQVDESVATVKVGSLRQIVVYASTTAPVVVDVVGYYVNHNHDDAYLTKAQAQGRTAANSFLCPTGSLIKSVAADGATTCVQDATGPVSSVGGGLLLDNGVLSGQGRSAANAFTCPAGQYLRSVAADGTPTCDADQLGEAGTTYSAGFGMLLVGNVFSAEQGRSAVNAFTCPAGQYLQAVAANGAPTCVTDKDTDTDTNTTYGAGFGLLLTDGVFSAEQGRSAASAFTCAVGQYLQSVAANGAPTCALDKDTNTTYSAGVGLLLNNGVFSADRSAMNAYACPTGYYLQAIAPNGAPTCGLERDTNTTYSAGVGLLLSNGVFSADRSAVSAYTCPAGQYLQAVAANGAPTCVTDKDTTYAAGPGLSLANGTFTAEQRRSVQNAFTCPPGQYLRVVAADGTPTCAADMDTDTNTTYSAGFGLLLANGVFSAQQGRSAANAFTCGIGEFLRSVAADGTPTCAIDKDTTYTAGSGISITGSTISAQQSRTAANAFTCPAGQALRVVGADGAPTCVAVPAYTAGPGLTLNGSTFSSSYGPTVIPIRADGTPAQNGTALRNAMTAVTGATEQTPYVLALAPGTYDLGAGSSLAALTMKPYVSVVGAGRGFTTITGGVVSQSGGLVNLGNNTTLSGVTVRNAVPTGVSWATAIMSNGANTARLLDVHGYASQDGGETYGLLAFAGSNISVENSQFTVVNPTATGTGIYSVTNATVRARNVEVSHGAVSGWALRVSNASRIEFADGYANGAVHRATPDSVVHLMHSKVDGAVTGGVQCFGTFTSAMAAATCA